MTQPVLVARLSRFVLRSLLITTCTLISARVLGDAPPEPLDRYPVGKVTVKGHHANRQFSVWLATTDARREQGLMFVKSLAPNQGMLFVFDQPDILTFWMKNTYIPLDLLYIAPDGHVVRIAENATPLSLTGIPSGKPASAVLEIGGGLAHSLGLAAGDSVVLTPAKP
jgi:hypothetical protein